MREMAYEYRKTAVDHGVSFIVDPFNQLIRAIFLVLESWNSETACVYRKQMQLCDDWGTGVIVQKMVLGNINYGSGTGVMFTKDPRRSLRGKYLIFQPTEFCRGTGVKGECYRVPRARGTVSRLLCSRCPVSGRPSSGRDR